MSVPGVCSIVSIFSLNGVLSILLVRDVSSLVDVEHSHVRFLGNLVLNLWDCGG